MVPQCSCTRTTKKSRRTIAASATGAVLAVDPGSAWAGGVNDDGRLRNGVRFALIVNCPGADPHNRHWKAPKFIRSDACARHYRQIARLHFCALPERRLVDDVQVASGGHRGGPGSAGLDISVLALLSEPRRYDVALAEQKVGRDLRLASGDPPSPSRVAPFVTRIHGRWSTRAAFRRCGRVHGQTRRRAIATSAEACGFLVLVNTDEDVPSPFQVLADERAAARGQRQRGDAAV